MLHCSLRFNLVWFLHSDSPFSRQKKIALSLSKGIERGVATFYDLPDIPECWCRRSCHRGCHYLSLLARPWYLSAIRMAIPYCTGNISRQAATAEASSTPENPNPFHRYTAVRTPAERSEEHTSELQSL